MGRAADAHANWVLQSCALKTLYFGRHSGREEIRMSSFSGQHFQDLVQDRAEVEVEQAIGFIEDHIFEVLERKSLGILEVVK